MKRVARLLAAFMTITMLSDVSASDISMLPRLDMFNPVRFSENLPIGEGFGALKWGILLEQAMQIYPDLREENTETYNKYVKGKKSVLGGVVADFFRSNEVLKAGGHQPDKVKYQFLDGRFFSVYVTFLCAEDIPCDVDAIFQDIVKAIRIVHGKPEEISSATYETDKMVKIKGGIVRTYEIKWQVDDESISIYKSVEPSYSSIGIHFFSNQGYSLVKDLER
jgi:hypothetical protein